MGKGFLQTIAMGSTRKRWPLNYWEEVNHDTKGDESPAVFTFMSPLEGSWVVNFKLLGNFLKGISLYSFPCKDGVVSCFDKAIRVGWQLFCVLWCSSFDLELSFHISLKISGLSECQRCTVGGELECSMGSDNHWRVICSITGAYVRVGCSCNDNEIFSSRQKRFGEICDLNV